MSPDAAFLWFDQDLRAGSGGTAAVVLVGDSFLLDDGAVLALDLHRDRFLASVSIQAPERRPEAEEFWPAAIAALPREGRWFPRIELARLETGSVDASFRVTVRPCPPLSQSIRLVTASHDPRRTPAIKGPDLARLEVLRGEARTAGSDEAVILSPDGTVVEGNYTSLVWWRGDALCVVADDVPRLPGVTERSLVTLATALGVEVLPDEVLPAELDGLELWALSSLHGIRIATAWVSGPGLAERPGRLRLWRQRLDALRRPLP
jgi:branched-subunit amino acid aminotransferase/4-amino-4-deoxychorismate lyase